MGCVSLVIGVLNIFFAVDPRFKLETPEYRWAWQGGLLGVGRQVGGGGGWFSWKAGNAKARAAPHVVRRQEPDVLAVATPRRMLADVVEVLAVPSFVIVVTQASLACEAGGSVQLLGAADTPAHSPFLLPAPPPPAQGIVGSTPWNALVFNTL